MYELLLNGNRADIDAAISVQISYAIDDVVRFAYRNTSFSKQIVLPSTAANNKLFGHVYELGSNNPYAVGGENLNGYFSVSQVTQAELRLNGLLVLKGVFRLIGIKRTRNNIEYEGALFGELGGFMAQIGNQKLEDLDFSTYNHTYNTTNIAASWTAAQGSGYFYPLIDYGTFSTDKISYDLLTFRPALYIKEYIDKMFEFAGYTYESDFFNTAFFKSLILPHNAKRLQKLSGIEGSATRTATVTVLTDPIDSNELQWQTASAGNFTVTLGNSTWEYIGASAKLITLEWLIRGTRRHPDGTLVLSISKNGTTIEGTEKIFAETATNKPYDWSGSVEFTITPGDVIVWNYFTALPDRASDMLVTASTSSMKFLSNPATLVFVTNGDEVVINDVIPKGVYGKDFFASILKMFNLYVTEDKLTDKKLIITPYIDFYTTERVDWSLKIARDKTWDIVPMGNLNGRVFEYKYKDDTDYYNEGYKRRYNQNYGDRQFDTGFQFSKDRDTTDIIFASSPLIQYVGTDKYLTAIYKKSKGNSIDQEELTDSFIRILQAKQISGVGSWSIKNGATVLSTQTNYGYAGHLNDPVNPTIDINFGAPNELYCSPDQYTSNNLFNTYWSEYIAEIADKDSKLLKCYIYLTALDIANLDFSTGVFIDGNLFRLNKVEDYDYRNNELTKVELLKVIHG
jgi:hypothetical protein